MTARGPWTFGIVALLATAVGLPAASPAAAASKSSSASSARLVPFASCAQVVRYARRQALRADGTGVRSRVAGIGVPSVSTPAVAMADGVSASPAPASAPKDSAGEAAPVAGQDFSATNVQEAGIDEPDVVKTDGRRLFAVTDSELRVFDVSTAIPRAIAALALDGFGHQLLLRGNRLLVLADSGGGPIGIGGEVVAPGPAPRAQAGSVIAPPRGTRAVKLTEISVRDSAKPVVLRTMSVPGTLVGGRQTQGTARVVISSSAPVLDAAQIRRSTTRTWVPRTTLKSRVTGRTLRRHVVACGDISRPRSFSGLDLLSVLTIDLDTGLYNVDRDAILAGADTVYASASSLYVASRRWLASVESGRRIPDAVRTEIHRFDTSRPDVSRYRSSGSVPGFILDNYALSEQAGVLRVATTSEPQWFGDGPGAESESFVSTLKEKGGRLAPLGRVGGLGKGERIFAVRFIGDVGYVVTFRQTDPLYTVDLSRPTAPKVLGELKIAGYSAYLHPVGDGRLLGVGQDADDQGRTTGSQVSLFDVSDLRDPRRVSQIGFGGGAGSDVEFDPYAFLYWGPAKLAVLPLTRSSDQGETAFHGAVGIRTGASSLTGAARITHPPREGRTPSISRSVVVGDRVLTLSYAGLQANRLDTLAPVAFTPVR